MSTTVAQRFDLWARNLMPGATTFLAAILSVVPVGFGDFAHVTPAYVMMSIFYWAVYRPDLMPPTVVFILGLLHDIVTGFPVGGGALVLLAVWGGALSQRQAFLGKPFFIAWLGFVVIAGIAQAVLWLILSLYTVSIVAPLPVLGQYLITVTAFPLVAWVFVRIHRYLVR